MTTYATRLENSTDTRPRMRRADSLPMTAELADGPLATRSGLRPGGGEVAAVNGTMQVTVTELVAWVEGGSTDTQAGYPVVSDDVETLLLSDGDPTLDRTDTIVVQVRDNTYDASGFTDADVTVVEGVPGAGAPALPASAVPLRDVTVTAGLSAGGGGLSGSNIATDRRVYTAALGGIVPAGTQPASPYAGQAYYDLATGDLLVFNGTAWEAMARKTDMAGGTVNVVQTAGQPTGSGVVTFPAGRFSVAPVVTTTDTSVNVDHVISATNITATGCTLTMRHIDGSTAGTTHAVGWIAYEV